MEACRFWQISVSGYGCRRICDSGLEETGRSGGTKPTLRFWPRSQGDCRPLNGAEARRPGRWGYAGKAARADGVKENSAMQTAVRGADGAAYSAGMEGDVRLRFTGARLPAGCNHAILEMSKASSDKL